MSDDGEAENLNEEEDEPVEETEPENEEVEEDKEEDDEEEDEEEDGEGENEERDDKGIETSPKQQVSIKLPPNEEEGGETADDDDAKAMDSGMMSPDAEQKAMDKQRHSMAANAQAELNKQKVLKTKQEREGRRAALDNHHQYIIDFIAFYTDQKAKDVEEFVIDSPEFVSLMENFFQPNGTRALLFYYQDHDAPGPESGRTGVPAIPGTKKDKIKRIIVTPGSDIPMKSLCMYFLRPNTTEKITVKNVSDECYFGMVTPRNPDEPGIVLGAMNDMLETLLGRLDLKEVSNLDEISENAIRTTEDILIAARNPETVQKIEHVVIFWCKNIERVLATSKQMRKETDNMGPLAELAYWRNLMATMCYIIQQTQEWQLVNMIQVLMQAKSRVLRRWKDVDSRVSDEYHESRDNVRYMYALEKFCQPLYEHDPPGMIEHINSMMYTIRTIHTTSRYYNTCEKVTALMVKISNQMVASCRRYLTNDGTITVWNQESSKMVEKLNKCIELYETYRGSYETTKAELSSSPDGKHFDVSVNHIFGRFEKFCDRLKKIIKILEIFNLYSSVHESYVDGLGSISLRLNDLQREIQMKSYDPLEFRQPEFDNDFIVIRGAIDEIQIDLEKFMDAAIEACPTAMHGLRLLERFQNLNNQCLDIDGKLWYLFQFYHNEIVLIQQIYEAEKNDTPTPRGFPPFAGKIAWSRHLYRRLERPMKWFQEKTEVLKRDGVTPTIKLFNSVAKKLIFYEILFHESWMNQCNSIYDALEAPVLTLTGSMRQELVLNFDPFFRQIIEETEIIRKMELEVPDIAQVVYCKKDKLYATYEHIKGLLERFLKMKTQMPQDLSLLMRPIVKKVEKAFMPGVTNINWTSFKTEEYFNYIEVHQNELEEIIRKVQEIITLRINQVLYDISHTMLLDIPDEHPITPEEFMEGVHRYGGLVGVNLEYKSRVCENAVGELINCLLTSCEIPIPGKDFDYTWLASSGALPMPAEERKKNPTDKPLVDPTLVPTQMAKEEVAHIYEECRHVFAFYNQKCIEALQKATRISLDILRGRTEEPQISKRNPGKIINRVPLFIAELVLTIPTITLKPTLAEMQQVLIRGIQLICESLKRVILWGQSRRSSFAADSDSPFYKEAADKNESVDDDGKAQYGRLQHADAYLRTSIQVDTLNSRLKNCFKHVMEHKDVSKLVLMMQTVVVQAKPKVQLTISQYMHYHFLWKDTRDEEVAGKIAAHSVITEIEAIMRTYKELGDEIEGIPSSHRAGPLEVLTREMKLGFQIEAKEWKLSYCRELSNRNKMVCFQITKFMDECNKELQMPIKDMNDLYAVMSTLIRIRENIFKYDSMLQPIEECYKFLSNQNFRVPEEESNKAFGLRGSFNKLLVKAIQTQQNVCSTQAKNKTKLIEQVGKFKQDLKAYLERYESKGPMKEGISVEVATERLYTFQDEFDDLWERYTMCLSGEKLFGLSRNYYPELGVVKKQLSLLQKLYSLFNDVLRTLNSYSELRWKEVDMDKVTDDMKHFQARCMRLPKSMSEWKTYKLLTTKINALNDWCPLLVLLINKGMKQAHWEKLAKITGFKFDAGHENFTLKLVMEVADKLLKYKTEIEEICNQAIKEKEIEEKMRQLELMNEFT